MNAKALTMITVATLSVLALSACGSQATMRTGQVADTQTRSSSIQVGSDGGQVMSDGNGGSVSIGADGVHIDSGDGSSVDIGPTAPTSTPVTARSAPGPTAPRSPSPPPTTATCRAPSAPPAG